MNMLWSMVLTVSLVVQSIEGVPKICEGLNPATWILESSTTPVAEERLGMALAQHYRESDLYRHVPPCCPPPLSCCISMC
jgi:hypothetical protein